MIELKGSITNQYGEVIVPEHPILEKIKLDAKNNSFGCKSVYNQMKSEELVKAREVMEEFGTILTGAIFNGNSEVPLRAVAKLEGFNYKPQCRQWYTLLALNMPGAILNPISKTILDALSNYKFLSYIDYTYKNTYIDEYQGVPSFGNMFTEAFDFNPLSLEYLVSRLKTEIEYNTVILTPKDTCKFVSEMVDYLKGNSEDRPEELMFDNLMGDCITKAVNLELFDCTNIVIVSEDLLVLALPANEVFDLDKLSENFLVLYSKQSTGHISKVEGNSKITDSNIFNK